MSFCYSDGTIKPIEEARISLTDLGVTRGYGVFDFLRTYNGKPFLFNEHLERFKNSSKQLNLDIPLSDSQIQEICNELINKNGFEESNVKFVLTGGEEESDQNNLYIMVTEFQGPDPSVHPGS